MALQALAAAALAGAREVSPRPAAEPEGAARQVLQPAAAPPVWEHPQLAAAARLEPSLQAAQPALWGAATAAAGRGQGKAESGNAEG
ncbi:hypothetical protein [Methylocystis sp.]|uniref:hypothetical protein n=1 Tax=Methylocystis sp. TaxID=1911079 RepID=UPI0025E3CD06|nr:hypothetical protein [Methylocystis sp.]